MKEAMFKQLVQVSNDFIDILVLKNCIINRKKASEIIDSISIESLDLKNTTGTFSANRKLLQVIYHNYLHNKDERNIFLLFHELTHILGSINNTLYNNSRTIPHLQTLQKEFNDSKFDFINAFYGILLIDEALSQNTCEEVSDVFFKRDKREKYKYNKGPLKSKICFSSSFEKDDIYSISEGIVDSFACVIGFSNITEMAHYMLQEDIDFNDYINHDIYELLCYMGIICKGIYKENNFNSDINVTKDDVEQAFKSLTMMFESKINLENNQKTI